MCLTKKRSRNFLKIKYGQSKIGISQFIMQVEVMMTVMGRTAKITKIHRDISRAGPSGRAVQAVDL